MSPLSGSEMFDPGTSLGSPEPDTHPVAAHSPASMSWSAIRRGISFLPVGDVREIPRWPQDGTAAARRATMESLPAWPSAYQPRARAIRAPSTGASDRVKLAVRWLSSVNTIMPLLTTPHRAARQIWSFMSTNRTGSPRAAAS
jgi:hypothetical protein